MSLKGIKTPLDVRPRYPIDYDWYLETFQNLSTSRNSGMGLAFIPYTEYLAYFKIFDSLDDIRQDILILNRMDRAFVRIQSKEQEQKANRQKVKSNPHGTKRPNRNTS